MSTAKPQDKPGAKSAPAAKPGAQPCKPAESCPAPKPGAAPSKGCCDSAKPK